MRVEPTKATDISMALIPLNSKIPSSIQLMVRIETRNISSYIADDVQSPFISCAEISVYSFKGAKANAVLERERERDDGEINPRSPPTPAS